MQIPLNNFEQYIDETILQHGVQYVEDGCVHEGVNGRVVSGLICLYKLFL